MTSQRTMSATDHHVVVRLQKLYYTIVPSSYYCVSVNILTGQTWSISLFYFFWGLEMATVFGTHKALRAAIWMSGSAGKSKFMKSIIIWVRTISVGFTVKPGNCRTPEIFWECYCLAREKPIRCEKTKPQAKMLIFWECYCFAREKPIRCEKTKLQARLLTSLWFRGQLRVLIFAVIGHNTITIPEIFKSSWFSQPHCNN